MGAAWARHAMCESSFIRRYYIIKMNLKEVMRDGAEWSLLVADKARGTYGLFTLAWKQRFQATGRQHRGCTIPQAVTHSLVLLQMGGIIGQIAP